jgi:cytochrome c oxidase assembly protein subunit 15
MQLSAVRQADNAAWRFWISLGLILVFCQIALGGWVSSNYAGVACVGFPQCNGQWVPALHFSEAFQFISPIGTNYQGGVLDSDARVTIQFVHRLGAMVVAGYLLMLSAWLWSRSRFPSLRRVAFFIACLVLAQFTLGILNVVYLLPLWVAVCHNGVAALLLALMLVMRYLVSGEARNASSF